jgi:hypothetical protein
MARCSQRFCCTSGLGNRNTGDESRNSTRMNAGETVDHGSSGSAFRSQPYIGEVKIASQAEEHIATSMGIHRYVSMSLTLRARELRFLRQS